MGRPKIDPKKKKQHLLGFLLTTKEKQKLEKIRSVCRLSYSDIIRTWINHTTVDGGTREFQTNANSALINIEQ